MTTDRETLPRYDWHQSYDWNYANAPNPVDIDIPAVAGEWTFCGLPVASPLGIPAGPLLNGRWLLYYASLGFDVLTYKTVRSVARSCYELPNLVPVEDKPLDRSGMELDACTRMSHSWAISFGMPSKAPDVWRADVELTRRSLGEGKVLCVSVVGSVQTDWSVEQLADDYAQCAVWAVDAGADAVELNFSCPNVSSCDGQLYQDYSSARTIALRTRAAIGSVPLILKIGHVEDDQQATNLLDAVADCCDGLSMTNCLAATVRDTQGKWLFAGQSRGIGGRAIRQASITQVERFRAVAMARGGRSPELIGVGGANSASDVHQYLAAGASSVHVATAAMLRPDLALEIRSRLNRAHDEVLRRIVRKR